MDYYYHPASPNCRKTSAVIRHLDLEPAYHVVDLPKGEQQSPEFLAINPNGRVPALVDGDTRLWESNAIIIYLADKAESELWPNDPTVRLDILKWMFWEQSHFMDATGTVFFQRLIVPLIGEGEPDQARITEAISKFRRCAAVLETILSKHEYLVGDVVTLADFAVASNLTFAAQTGLPLSEFSNIVTWLDALDRVPAWKATEPRFPG